MSSLATRTEPQNNFRQKGPYRSSHSNHCAIGRDTFPMKGMRRRCLYQQAVGLMVDMVRQRGEKSNRGNHKFHRNSINLHSLLLTQDSVKSLDLEKKNGDTRKKKKGVGGIRCFRESVPLKNLSKWGKREEKCDREIRIKRKLCPLKIL